MITIVNKFFPHSTVAGIEPFGKGHINDTYKIDLHQENKSYILQRINTNVFKDPFSIAETHVKIQNIVSTGREPFTIAELIPTADGKKMYADPETGVWRMTSYIGNSYTVDVVEHPWQACEAGKAFGWFVTICTALDPDECKESIRDFHRLSFRLRQLREAVSENRVNRLTNAKELIDFYRMREDDLLVIETLVNRGKIPLRVVHNDTKINNVLFRDDKAAAVIDLDTVGPGILYYDYGDAVRTIATTAGEDEPDLKKVSFHIDAFKAFTEGYLEQVSTIINVAERELFHKAPFLMTYLMGIRFLTDYLNGDVYYKTDFSEHNIVRSRVQKKLIESMEQHVDVMKKIIGTL